MLWNGMYLLSLKSEEKNELCYANERQNEKKTEEDEIASRYCFDKTNRVLMYLV